MKARTRTAVAAVALLGLAALALLLARYGVERPAEREKKAKEAEEKIFAFDPAQVKAVRVEARGSEVRLERAGEGWRVVAPVQTQADRAAADGLVSKMADLRRRSSIAEADAGGAGRFGLDRPRFRVELTLADGGRRLLEAGEENPFDGSFFARAGGGPVVSVGGEARFALEKDLLDLREKQLLPVEENAVSRLEVKGPKLAFALERSGAGWRLAAPVSERADEGTVGRLLAALRGLRAARFVDVPGPGRDYGLDRPRWHVRLVGPGETVRTLALGAPAAGRGTGASPAAAELWARASGSPAVAAVPERQVKDLEVDLWALRDKAALHFEPDQVAALKVDRGGTSLQLQRGPAAADGGPSREWVLTAPRTGPVTAWKASGLLYALRGLRAIRFADESGKRLAEHGLDRPEAAVTLLGAGGETLGRLEVGKTRGEETFVRSSEGPRILAVVSSSLGQIPKGPEDLEEKPPAAGKDGG